MEPEEIEFDQWWAEFLAEAEGRSDPSLVIEALCSYIAGLPHEKRRAFERCLVGLVPVQRAGATLALAALERGALLETYEAVVSLAGRSLGTRNELREGVLRVLARAGLPQGEALLEQYLLHDPIGPHWSAVPWSLWPQATLLFCRAWSRYFTEKSPETWGGTAVVQAFLKEPQAVRLLRTALQAENAVAWAQLQRELLQAAAAPWLAQAERNALLSELSA